MSTVTKTIEEKLVNSLSPTHLQVINESHKHNVPPNSETHFQVVVVSNQFQGKSLVQRHRLVNVALQVELEGPVHALSIVAKTPEQWQEMLSAGKRVDATPNCRGGDGSLPKKSEQL